jgi:very-short-patch-repair endonuclease
VEKSGKFIYWNRLWLKNTLHNTRLTGITLSQNPASSIRPPLEGCPQDRVADSPPLEGWSQTGVVETPQDKIIFIKKIKIKLNPILELPYNPKLKQRAKELRQAGNLPEVLFWMQVTKGGFHKIDFDRQRVIGNYIVDFYVKKLGLVVEIDGVSHIGKEDYDREREDFLISLGLRVYRIRVEDIMQRMPEVMVARWKILLLRIWY